MVEYLEGTEHTGVLNASKGIDEVATLIRTDVELFQSRHQQDIPESPGTTADIVVLFFSRVPNLFSFPPALVVVRAGFSKLLVLCVFLL
jgi:hypothetical protein